MWLVWWWEQEKPSLLLDQSPSWGPWGCWGRRDTAGAFFKWICNFSNGCPSWTVLCVFWGCFTCSSGVLRRREVSWSAPGAVVFPSLTIFASTSSDFLGHGEHGWRQDVALCVWMNVCVNQLSGRGCPHGRTSLRVCSGLEEPNKVKPYLMLRFSLTSPHCQTCNMVDALLWQLPQGNGCHIRLTHRTEEYVQLCESGHNRWVCDGDSYVASLQRKQRLHTGDMLHEVWCLFYSQHQKASDGCLPWC